jgi:hypothetical protein
VAPAVADGAVTDEGGAAPADLRSMDSDAPDSAPPKSPPPEPSDLAVAPAGCNNCGAHQICSGATCVDLPTQCPCPLGSYCDLATNACIKGCLGNDQCPADQRCDTSVFQCALICNDQTVCPNHMACPFGSGVRICSRCVEPTADMGLFSGLTCFCAGGYGDCNHDPSDGCETPLNTLTNCGSCGRAASTLCLVDQDGDGYGTGKGTTECQCTPGTVAAQSSADVDCDDSDPNAHPGQTNYFTQPRKSGGYDYDCDGFESVEWDYPIDTGCSVDDCEAVFWVHQEPDCGAQGTVHSCYFPNYPDESVCSVRPGSSPMTQACR